MRWDPVSWGAWCSALGRTVIVEAPMEDDDEAGPVPCEEAEAVLAGWRGQDRGPCEEAEAVFAGCQGHDMVPCGAAEASPAGIGGSMLEVGSVFVG